MNVQLAHVLADITGATGLAIIRAMVAGERDPVPLARFRAPRCASSTREIAKALTGHDQPEHVFALKQALALYDIYTERGRTYDAEIERPFQVIRSVWPDELPPLNRADTPPTHNKAFRLAAHAVSRRHNGLGAFYRRMRPGLGPKAAIVAPPTKSRASSTTCAPIAARFAI